MNRSLILALFLSFLVIAGLACSQTPEEPKAVAQEKESKQIPPEVPVEHPTKEKMEKLVEGNNEFAFDLYRRLSQQQGNIVFSPYSISTALAMTYGGARGKTASEMERSLHFRLPPERLHAAFGEVTRQMSPMIVNPPYSLEMANAIWPQQGYPVKKAYQQLVHQHYGAEVTPLDFGGDSEAARQTINHWVAKRTQQKIKELLGPDEISSDTRLVLTNTAYFKAGWLQPFGEGDTKREDFEVEPGKLVKASMMHNDTVILNYGEKSQFKIVELPYGGHRLSLVILLPNREIGLAGLEKALTVATLEEALSHLDTFQGDISLPRFKFSFRRNLDQDLQKLGMSSPFLNTADFTDMNDFFHISRVIHEAMISVDEEGTEAAAATALDYEAQSFLPFSFRANHPFLFLIRDRKSGTILFLGRVTDPQK